MGFGGPQVMHLGFGDRISAASPPRCQLLSPGKWPVGSIVIRKGSSQWKRSRCTRSHNTSKVQSYQTLILQTWQSKSRSQVILVSRSWKHLDSGIQKKTQALHTNSNPSITAKSPIISLGYTRIIKKQGALNKKTLTKHKDFSQSTLNCVLTSATKLQDVSTFMHHWDAKLQFICFPDLRVFGRRADFPPSLRWF